MPDETAALRTQLEALLPRMSLSPLLIEIDQRTGFTAQLTHVGGKQARSGELSRNLLVLVLGLAAMSQATGISEDTLSWTAEWHLRENILRAVNAAIMD